MGSTGQASQQEVLGACETSEEDGLFIIPANAGSATVFSYVQVITVCPTTPHSFLVHTNALSHVKRMTTETFLVLRAGHITISTSGAHDESKRAISLVLFHHVLLQIANESEYYHREGPFAGQWRQAPQTRAEKAERHSRPRVSTSQDRETDEASQAPTRQFCSHSTAQILLYQTHSGQPFLCVFLSMTTKTGLETPLRVFLVL